MSQWFHSRDTSSCEPPDPATTVTDRLNTLLNSSGPSYVLRLCPGMQYMLQAPIAFAAPYQEISTLGYPTGDERATLVVSGSVVNGVGQTTAIDGACSTCSGIAIRNIQINGARNGASPIDGGANIEIGGDNSDQLVEYVHSFDPRSWSCLHVAEGSLSCTNVTLQNNDIGPCGSDQFQQWADGISLSCRSSVVRNNLIQGPTDGGIVLFGSPGSQVYNNTIWITNQTLLGGINLVDFEPFLGDYTGTVVRNNLISGGFSTSPEQPGELKGTNNEDAVIKVGIAIGPRTWFGDGYGTNVSRSGTVINNVLTGAFSYGIAITSAVNFTVQGNSLIGNTSFIGSSGPNCTQNDNVPNPGPFVLDTNLTSNLDLQSNFQTISDGASLICVIPPDGGDFWPFGGKPSGQSPQPSNGGPPGNAVLAIALSLVFGLIAIAIISWFIRKRVLQRRRKQAPSNWLHMNNPK